MKTLELITREDIELCKRRVEENKAIEAYLIQRRAAREAAYAETRRKLEELENKKMKPLIEPKKWFGTLDKKMYH